MLPHIVSLSQYVCVCVCVLCEQSGLACDDMHIIVCRSNPQYLLQEKDLHPSAPRTLLQCSHRKLPTASRIITEESSGHCTDHERLTNADKL